MISEKEVLDTLDKFKSAIINLKKTIKEKEVEIESLKAQLAFSDEMSQKINDTIREIELELNS